MNHPEEILLIIGISSFVIIVIAIVVGLLFASRGEPTQRVRKASLPPLHCGYKPLPGDLEQGYRQTPPKPPEGSGGGSL